MKKVLVLATSRKTRGGITAVIQAYESSPIWNLWRCEWIETHIDRSVTWKLWYFFKAMVAYLPRLVFCDLVHIHLSEPSGAVRKLLFALPAFCLCKPVILHFHSFSPQSTIDSRWAPVYGFLFRNARATIVLSPFWERAVRGRFGNLNVQVVPNPCSAPLEGLPPRSGPRPYVLFAGTLNARKGYSELISAFARIAGECAGWDLVIAGNGELTQARRLTHDLGIETRVHFPGWVVGHEKAALFQNAGVFCLPSHAEGFPMAVLDAFTYGIPVVTTPVGGIPDMLEDRQSASIVPSGDIASLAEALKELIESPSMRAMYSGASRRLAADFFSLQAICSRMDSLYAVTTGGTPLLGNGELIRKA